MTNYYINIYELVRFNKQIKSYKTLMYKKIYTQLDSDICNN